MKKETIRQKTHESVDKIMDKAESLEESGQKALAGLKEKVLNTKENVDGYIRRNPEKSVLIAAGIGTAVGAILAAIALRRKD